MNARTPLHEICSIFIDRNTCTNLDDGNNTFVFNFPKQIYTTESTRISVSNFSVPYSWFNISEKKGNNKLAYVWTDNTGVTTVSFTIDDGNYALSDINKFLQFKMVQNGHYLIDTIGNFVYYLEFVYNVVRYRIQLNSYTFPATLPAGWTAGSGVVFTGVQFNAPVLKLTASEKNGEAQATNLALFFGVHEPVAYPLYLPVSVANGSNRSSAIPLAGTNVNGIQMILDDPPELDTVHSIDIACYGVDNPLRSSANQVSTYIITAQNINVKFGENIVNSNFLSTWIPLAANQVFSSLTFSLTDQSGNPLLLVDPDTNIEFLLTNVRY